MAKITKYYKDKTIPTNFDLNPNADICTCKNQYNDSNLEKVIIELDKNTNYIQSYQIYCQCDFKLIGENSTITIPENLSSDTESGVDTNSRCYDESLINFHGKDTSIEIKNINFNFSGTLKRNNWEENYGFYFIKLENLNGVEIDNISMVIDSQKLTNIDIRGCSNVTIKNSRIENYHANKIGGCIWVRNNSTNSSFNNINIIDNHLKKMGNDECIAIWTSQQSNYGNSMKNILISRNKFEYTKESDSSSEYVNDVFIKIYNEDSSISFNNCSGSFSNFVYGENYEHIMENIIISDNIFHINYIVHKIISFWNNGYFFSNNIIIKHNTIIISNFQIPENITYKTLGVFGINDVTNKLLNITIEDNVIQSSNLNLDNETPIVEALSLYGGNILFQNNTINAINDAKIIGIAIRNNQRTNASSSNTSSNNDIMLQNYINLTCRSNVFSGLFLLGSFSYPLLSPNDIIIANFTDNFFEGDTKIYCNNIASLHADFDNNYYKNSKISYVFQNFAQNGRFLFRNNTIKPSCSNNNCQIYKCYSITDNSHFDYIGIINNKFINIIKGSNLLGFPSDSNLSEINNYYIEE